MQDKLEYVDLKFDGGLWSVGDYLIPPNGAAELQDCYPLLTGGLRAWAKMSTFSRAGIASTHLPIAVFGRPGIAVRSGGGTNQTDRYLVTMTSSDKVGHVWRWDETDDVAPYTTWHLLKNFAAATASTPGASIFQIFRPDTGTRAGTTSVYLLFSWPGSADYGLWQINYSDGVMHLVKASTGQEQRAFVIHQDRLLFSAGARVYYSDPGSEAFPAPNFLDVFPDTVSPEIVFMKSFFGEIFLGKQGSPMFLVQGDITDPTDRTLSDAVPPIETQQVAETTEGIVYCGYGSGYYVTQSGVQVAPLSPQIAADQIASASAVRGSGGDNTLGGALYVPPFLITPSGHIYDSRTKAWFRTSEFGLGTTRGIAKHMAYIRDVDNPHVMAVPNTTNFDILTFSADEASMTRKSSFSYKSGPLRRDDGRRMGIREVLIPMNSHRTGSIMSVTVNGVTRQITGISSGRGILRFPFDDEAEYLDVRVVSDSGDSNFEAPTIEVVRGGMQTGHLINPDTVATV